MTEYPKLKKSYAVDGRSTTLPSQEEWFNSCHTQFSTALRERASVKSICKILDGTGHSPHQENRLAQAISNHILNGLEG